MALWEAIKPRFWDHRDVSSVIRRHLFNFRRMWVVAVLLTAGVALLPLIGITLVDYSVTQSAFESEILLRTSRIASNTWRTVSFFLSERRSALDFIVRHHSYAELSDPRRLGAILDQLASSFGGFADLGLIASDGRQQAYVGPYELAGKDYSEQAWFDQVRQKGVFISDVFLGFRNVPHMVIAIKHQSIGQGFYVLRATLDIERFNSLLSQIELEGHGDAFIINQQGILQTPSRDHGKVLESIALGIPAVLEHTQVYEAQDAAGKALVVGYTYIADTPFILMIVKQKDELMAPWHATRRKRIGFLAVSVTGILIVILGVATYLVGRIYLADQERVRTLHQVEYANKLASLGRLSAGVAHEINNPLAIINEKAGLIKDLVTLTDRYGKDARLIGLVDAILGSVDRCATITRRMLSFARHMDVSIEPIDIGEVIREVLGFLGKEAEYRSIAIQLSVADGIAPFESDRGKLQQILLNLFNNAFAAMNEGGKLRIDVRPDRSSTLRLQVIDNGCGIPEADLKRIFEPFFSTKTKESGTGLGLSITYSLVQELGGRIDVASQEGVGTAFTIHLPLHPPETAKEKNHACPAG